MYGDISASRVQFGEEGSNPSRSSLLTFSELGDRTTPSSLMAGRPTLVVWYQVERLGISEFESQLGKEGSIPSRSSYFEVQSVNLSPIHFSFWQRGHFSF